MKLWRPEADGEHVPDFGRRTKSGGSKVPRVFGWASEVRSKTPCRTSFRVLNRGRCCRVRASGDVSVDGVWDGVAPFAAGEVGDVDAEGAARDGLLAEDAGKAPEDAVVDVHVQRKALVEAADQTEHHHEIHAAVALLVVGGECLEFGPKWVGVAVAHFGGLGVV